MCDTWFLHLAGSEAPVLVILVLSLGGVSYTAVRRLKRLEVGVQNVRGLIGELPPSQPVGRLTPLSPGLTSIPEWQQQEEWQQADLKKKTEQLREIREELDKLH